MINGLMKITAIKCSSC